MRCTRCISFLAVLALVTGCTVQRGTLDFPNPWFDLHVGPLTFMAFQSSTVLRVGGTYFTLALPFYAPILFAVMLLGVVRLVMKRRGHD
jgi:hypothetical protein